MKSPLGLLCAFAALVLSGPVLADAKWSAFGNAGPVKLGPGDWAIALESDWTDFLPDSDWSSEKLYGGIAYEPKKGLKFSDITNLSADYVVAEGCFGGGSPRFQINVETETGVKNVFVYLGTSPSFNDCPTEWTSSGNLIGGTDLRYDLTQFGVPLFYGDYQDALDYAGGLKVVGIQIVADGGWMSPLYAGLQTILVDNITVNNDTLKAKGFKK